MKTVAVFLSCLLMAGCLSNPKPVVGSANQFDSDTYLALVGVDTTIKSTETALNNGTFTGKVQTDVYDATNALITAYSVADTAYLAYHTAALAGTATAAQQADVSTKLQAAQSAINALVKAKAGN